MVRLFLFLFVFSLAFSCQKLPPEADFIEQNKVYGLVIVDDKLKGKCDGYLFVVVRKVDSPQPLAVKRVKNPDYPYKFVLSPADVMVESSFQLFEGELLLYVKTSKSGNPFEESGYCESDIVPVLTGKTSPDRRIKILINSYKE